MMRGGYKRHNWHTKSSFSLNSPAEYSSGQTAHHAHPGLHVIRTSPTALSQAFPAWLRPLINIFPIP